MKINDIGDEADFIIVARVNVAHGLFVERREADRISFTLMRHA